VRRWLVQAALAIALLAPGAWAAPTNDQRALQLFEESAKAYREARFDDCIRLLQQARSLKPVPVLLYDLGRAYDAIGRLDEAARSFEQYLREDPNAPDKKAIEARIATLRRQIAEHDTPDPTPIPPAPPAPLRPPPEPPPPPPPPQPAPEAPAPDPLRTLPWIVAGAGVVTLGVGVGFAVLAKSRHDTASADQVQASAYDAQNDAQRFATIANVAFIAGGALTVGGVAWLILRPSASPAKVSLVLGPSRVGVAGAF
jgi:tetratricopeptide (TPR) repeat protein